MARLESWGREFALSMASDLHYLGCFGELGVYSLESALFRMLCGSKFL